MDFINSLDGVEAVFVTRDKKVYSTVKDVEMEIVDETYKLEEYKK